MTWQDDYYPGSVDYPSTGDETDDRAPWADDPYGRDEEAE